MFTTIECGLSFVGNSDVCWKVRLSVFPVAVSSQQSRRGCFVVHVRQSSAYSVWLYSTCGYTARVAEWLARVAEWLALASFKAAVVTSDLDRSRLDVFIWFISRCKVTGLVAARSNV